MTRPDEIETYDVPGPGDHGQPGGGYRAAARLGTRDGEPAGIRVAVILAIVLVGAALGLAKLSPDIGPSPPFPTRSSTAPSLVVAPTDLPIRAILGAPEPASLLPVLAGGLRFFDPATGKIQGRAADAPKGMLFVPPDGRGLCVCVDSVIDASVATYSVNVLLLQNGRPGFPQGYAVGRYEAAWASGLELDEVAAFDATISLGGRVLWITRALRGPSTWEVAVDRLDMTSGTVQATTTVVSIPALNLFDQGAPGSPGSPPPWVLQPGEAVRPHIRATPNGDRISVSVEVVPTRVGFAGGVARSVARRYELPGEFQAGATVVAIEPPVGAGGTCDPGVSGWATQEHFVTACTDGDGAMTQPFVRVENAGDITRDIAVGPPEPLAKAEGEAWLLDWRSGVLFAWSPSEGVLTRLDVATRGMDTAIVGHDQVPDRGLPVGAALPPSWAPLTDAGSAPAPRLVGGADERTIFALGLQRTAAGSATPRAVEPWTTGIWVFDLAGARPVRRLEPMARYEEIGLSRDGQLVALSAPGSTADGARAPWPWALWYLDATTGAPIAIFGSLFDEAGVVPGLSAPNAPGWLAGF